MTLTTTGDVNAAAGTFTGVVAGTNGVFSGTLQFGGTAATGLKIVKGTTTPTSPGYDAPVGSIYIWTTTAAATGYLHTATATTGWTSLT